MNKFLTTKLSHQEIIDSVCSEIKEAFDTFKYSNERYNVPCSVLIKITNIDIENDLKKHSRLTDIVISLQIDNLYLNVVFLPFTTGINAHGFLKNFEFKAIANIKYGFDIFELKKGIDIKKHLNDSLFEIKENFDTIT